MKKGVVFLVLFFASCASTYFKEDNLIVDTENVTCVNDEVGFKIEKILSDSRCPEGVQCVRAGEVVLSLAVFKGNVKTEETELTIDYKNFEKNKAFFESKIPLKNKTISTILITPTKVAGQAIETNEYQLKILFTEVKD